MDGEPILERSADLAEVSKNGYGPRLHLPQHCPHRHPSLLLLRRHHVFMARDLSDMHKLGSAGSVVDGVRLHHRSGHDVVCSHSTPCCTSFVRCSCIVLVAFLHLRSTFLVAFCISDSTESNSSRFVTPLPPGGLVRDKPTRGQGCHKAASCTMLYNIYTVFTMYVVQPCTTLYNSCTTMHIVTFT